MKFFYKLFLCTAAILMVSLSVMTCITLSASLNSTVQQNIDSAVSQHQLLEYALECSMLTVSKTSVLSSHALGELAEQSAALLGEGEGYALMTAEGERLSGAASPLLTGTLPEPEELQYRIVTSDAGQELVVCSRFSQNNTDFVLYTVRDITYVFQNTRFLLEQERIVFLSVMAVSCLVMLGVAWLLARPIQSLKRAAAAFSEGDYSSRAALKTGDEFQALAEAYDQMAETLEQKIAALELAARQKEDFAANFAHELKTPMTSIIGYADMIYQKDLSPNELHRAAGYIVNEGMRLEALSFKLLDLIALERNEFLLEETQLETFFQDIWETVLPVAQKRDVSLTMDWADGWVRIEVDLFKTLLLNLLDNALKSEATAVTFTGTAEGSLYCIRIADNGRGIPAEELSRITEAFYMVDKSRSRREHGAGLGLALAARIAELHRTRLEYESQVGAGTTVSLRLAWEGDKDA